MTIDTEQAQGASVGQATPESRLAAMFGAEDERIESSTPQPQYELSEEVSETQETDEQPEEQPEQAEASETEDDGLVEFEYEGKTYRADPALKDAALRRSDYTRKTQELAELHRQAAAFADQHRAVAEFHKSTQKEQGELTAIESQIEAFRRLDWSQMDSEQLIRNRHQLDQLKDMANDLRKTLGEKQQEYQQTEAKRVADMAKAAYDYIGKQLPEFKSGSELEKAVAKYAESSGMPVDAFVRGTVAFPSLAIVMHKAMQYDQLQAKKATTVQAVKKAAPVVKPGAVKNTAGTQAVQKSREALKKTGTRQAAAAFFRHFEG